MQAINNVPVQKGVEDSSLELPTDLDDISYRGPIGPCNELIVTNFAGTGYPVNWLYQYDSVLHLVMYNDPQGDSLWHPLWPGSEYVDHEDRPPDDA